jgi:hypothetical protein
MPAISRRDHDSARGVPAAAVMARMVLIHSGLRYEVISARRACPARGHPVMVMPVGP